MSSLLAGNGGLAGQRSEADGRIVEPGLTHRGRGEGPQHHGAGGGHQVGKEIYLYSPEALIFII